MQFWSFFVIALFTVLNSRCLAFGPLPVCHRKRLGEPARPTGGRARVAVSRDPSGFFKPPQSTNFTAPTEQQKCIPRHRLPCLSSSPLCLLVTLLILSRVSTVAAINMSLELDRRDDLPIPQHADKEPYTPQNEKENHNYLYSAGDHDASKSLATHPRQKTTTLLSIALAIMTILAIVAAAVGGAIAGKRGHE